MLARHLRQKTVHTFMSKETQRHVAYQRTKYEERTAKGSEGHTGLLKKPRGLDTDLEKVYKAKATIKDWKEESRLVAEVALNPC